MSRRASSIGESGRSTRATKVVLGIAGAVLALVLFLGSIVVLIKTFSERDVACRCGDGVHGRWVTGWQQDDTRTCAGVCTEHDGAAR